MLNEKINYRAIILAGGQGTRLGNLTKKIPKPLLKIDGKYFILYLIKFLKKNNINDIVITTNYKRHLFKKNINNSLSKNIKFINEPKPLGTGGSFLNVIKKIKHKKNVINLICNGDTLFLFSLNKIKKFIEKNDYTILAVKKKNCKKYGRLKFRGQYLNGIKKNVMKSGYISSGFFFFKKFKNEIIQTKKKKLDFENDILNKMIDNKIKIKCVKLNCSFIDIGTPEDYKKTNNFIKKKYNVFIKKM